MDVSIEYSLGGRKVSREEFYGGIESRIRESTLADARTRLGGVRCPVHGRAPNISRLRVTPEGFQVQMSGCCSELLELAGNALR